MQYIAYHGIFTYNDECCTTPPVLITCQNKISKDMMSRK